MTLRRCALTTLSALGLLCAAHAQAALQPWTLTATTYMVEAGLNAPAYAQMGKTFSIQYLMDTEAPATPFGLYDTDFYAIENVKINGQVSFGQGYIWTGTGELNAINFEIDPLRADGLSFISLNNTDAKSAANVTQALLNFSQAVANGDTDVRLDFGAKSIWATPLTFTQGFAPAIPEPAAAATFLIGLAAIVAMVRRRKPASATV